MVWSPTTRGTKELQPHRTTQIYLENLMKQEKKRLSSPTWRLILYLLDIEQAGDLHPTYYLGAALCTCRLWAIFHRHDASTFNAPISSRAQPQPHPSLPRDISGFIQPQTFRFACFTSLSLCPFSS
uniref:Uncharacterized protein n=1 Tax=Rousettus aegyptiacus TaxID=9407 RepID=A0A7J8HSL5_ROUAE|nr:hypothetical protein HJG63_011080 [Rousettus aegyptiacus]